MAFCKNNSQQMSIENSLYGMTEREKNKLKNSWAEFFSSEIFPNICEERFSILYSANHASRPNNPVNVYLGLLLIRDMFNQSDEEAIDSLLFDLRYQHALHTSSMVEQPISKNSLSNFRAQVLKNYEETGKDLIQEEVEALAPILMKIAGIDGRTKRMDSMMVASSCRSLSRLELLYSVVSRMVKAIQRVDGKKLPESMERYLLEGHRNTTIYHSRNTDIKSKYAVLLEDAHQLKKALSETSLISLQEYQLLLRFLSEQSEYKEEVLCLKDPKTLSSETLQNPTDPDASYRKKGNKSYKGYVANLVESVGNNTGIVEHYDFQKNTYSDQKFCLDVINKLGEQVNPTDLIVDGAFYTTQNEKAANTNNIELLPTNLTGRKPAVEKETICDFVIDPQTTLLIQCPAGHAPMTSKYNDKDGIIHACFNKKHCEQCERYDKCPIIRQKKKNVFRVSKHQYQLAHMKVRMGTEEYRDRVTIRAGVEGVPSVLRRKHRVDEMPIRGLMCAKIWFGIKVGASNLRRTYKMWKDELKNLLQPRFLLISCPQ